MDAHASIRAAIVASSGEHLCEVRLPECLQNRDPQGLLQACLHGETSDFLNCGLPCLSREQIRPSRTALAFGSAAAICFPSSEKKRRDAIAREQLSMTVLDHGECLPCSEPSYSTRRSTQDHRRSGPLQERHWLEIGMHAETISITRACSSIQTGSIDTMGNRR